MARMVLAMNSLAQCGDPTLCFRDDLAEAKYYKVQCSARSAANSCG